MEYHFRLIKQDESKVFFQLIDKNRNRLQRYFPNTVKEIQTESDALSHLKASEELHLKKEKYLFGLYVDEQLAGYINVKNFVWDVPKCELGYFIDAGFEGKKLMSRVVDDITDYCFETLKMEKVYLRIGPENKGSIKVAERSGYELEGVLRNEFRVWTGELIDVLYYGKLK